MSDLTMNARISPKLLDCLDEGVVLIHHIFDDCQVVLANQCALNLFKHQAGDISAMDLDEFFGNKLASLLRLAIKSNQQTSIKTTAPTDVHLVLKIQISPVDIQQSLVVIKDYTRIEYLEQIRTDFVGSVSHELRTPLTVILGYLENFLAVPMSEKYRRGLERMQEQAQRMNLLINDLLMLSKLESDENWSPEIVNMPKLLMKIFDDAQTNNRAGHLIDIHLDTDKCILGVEDYLYSAISNVVLNAIKYTPDGGEIDIIWEEVADEMHLSVIDNGIGIETHHIPRLTERFYRVDGGRSRMTGGTGLGLAIVKHVLSKHHARLQIESIYQQGSCFRLIFPASLVIQPING